MRPVIVTAFISADGVLDELGPRSIGHLECEAPVVVPTFTHLDATTAM